MKQKKLRRSGGVIAGVCSGLAEYFGTQPVWIRLTFVVMAFFHGLGLLGYVVLAVVMKPVKPKPPLDCFISWVKAVYFIKKQYDSLQQKLNDAKKKTTSTAKKKRKELHDVSERDVK